MDSVIERIKSIKVAQAEIEQRIQNDSLTLEEIKTLDDEWEILDAELAMYDDILFQHQLAEQAELEIAEPEEQDDYDWTNPSEEDVERWDLERQRMSGWGYEGEGTFDLADEI